jgi:hypothetical protein
MNRPFPLKLTSPVLVIMLPSTLHLGQNACLIEPQGLVGSVPKVVFPSFPTIKPGETLVNFKFTNAFSFVADLIVYEDPSSDSSSEQLSAKKLSILSSNPKLSSGSEHHWCGVFPSGYIILLLN